MFDSLNIKSLLVNCIASLSRKATLKIAIILVLCPKKARQHAASLFPAINNEHVTFN